MTARRRRDESSTLVTKTRAARRLVAEADPGERLIRATADWLKSVGWVAVLAGPIRVQSYPGDRKGKYEVVIAFLGGERKKGASKR
jgi:hypothetical protein